MANSDFNSTLSIVLPNELLAELKVLASRKSREQGRLIGVSTLVKEYTLKGLAHERNGE